MGILQSVMQSFCIGTDEEEENGISSRNAYELNSDAKSEYVLITSSSRQWQKINEINGELLVSRTEIGYSNAVISEEIVEEEEEEDAEVHVKNIVTVNEKERKIKHYRSSHKILLVGEGDFSFSACLALAFGSATNIVATSLNSLVDDISPNCCCHNKYITRERVKLLSWVQPVSNYSRGYNQWIIVGLSEQAFVDFLI